GRRCRVGGRGARGAGRRAEGGGRLHHGGWERFKRRCENPRMDDRKRRSIGWPCCGVVGLGLALFAFTFGGSADRASADLKDDFSTDVQPLVKKYCLGCHSTKVKRGSLDLERFATLDHVRKDLKPWQGLIEMLETGEMPPKDNPQPTAAERKRLIAWARAFLDAEARARAGDPGRVPLRRLS